MHIKITLRYYFPLIWMFEIKKSTIPSTDKEAEQLKLVQVKKLYNHFEKLLDGF